MFYHDSSKYTEEPSKKFKLIPENFWVPFEIVDAEELESKSGMPMIKCVCQVIKDPSYAGTKVWHYVTFFPEGHKAFGMSIHFRKSIGQPFGGNDLIDHLKWIGCKFMGKVGIDEYKGKQNNKIKEVSPIPWAEKEDEIPF